MKTFLFSLLFLLAFSCNKEVSIIENDVKEFQYKMNVHFLDKKTSPLTKTDFKTFKTLAYFTINKDLVVTANFKVLKNEQAFKMLTTTSRVVDYRKYGVVTFKIKDKKFSLNVYQNLEFLKKNPSYDDLFLPFKDLTNGQETYEGGRYIDLKIPRNENIIIDFNKSYNPYCAYNTKYSCPIPPSDNSLNIAIKAGVLAFTKQH